MIYAYSAQVNTLYIIPLLYNYICLNKYTISKKCPGPNV